MVPRGTSIYRRQLRDHDHIFYQPLVRSTIKTTHPGKHLRDVVASVRKQEGIRGSDVDSWERTYSSLLGHARLSCQTLRQLVDSEGFLDPSSKPIEPFNNISVYTDNNPTRSPGACVHDLAAIALPKLPLSPPASELGRSPCFTHADLLSWPTIDYVLDE